MARLLIGLALASLSVGNAENCTFSNFKVLRAGSVAYLDCTDDKGVIPLEGRNPPKKADKAPAKTEQKKSSSK